MPTASGRETAQEKRDRQHRQRWDRIEATIAAMPPGHVDKLAREYAAKYNAAVRALDGPGSISSVSLMVDTEEEAIAVCRAAEALGADKPHPVLTFDLRYGGETRSARGFAQWRRDQPQRPPLAKED